MITMGAKNLHIFHNFYPTMTKVQVVFIAISLFTTIFTAVCLVSPGFYRISFSKYVKYENRGTVVNSYNYFPNDNGVPNTNGGSHVDTFWRYKKSTINCALYYFHVCVLTQTLDGLNSDKTCQTSSYAEAKSKSDHLPTGFAGLTLDNIYGNIKDIANLVILEFEIEMPLALVCLLVGIVTEIIFYRSSSRDRRIGLTSFYTHLVAGVLLAVVTGKGAVVNSQLEGLLNSQFGYDVNTATVGFPYCILLTAVCTILCFVCAMKLIHTMTNQRLQISKSQRIAEDECGIQYNEMPEVSVQHKDQYKVEEIPTK